MAVSKFGRTSVRDSFTPPGSISTGDESEYACAIAPNAFSQPGPYCTAHTPTRSPRLARA
ncbi:Uncharacterised protein [Bordetella pertussis]|nr:Uncharacterised protein [Bordetella pertussis]